MQQRLPYHSAHRSEEPLLGRERQRSSKMLDRDQFIGVTATKVLRGHERVDTSDVNYKGSSSSPVSPVKRITRDHTCAGQSSRHQSTSPASCPRPRASLRPRAGRHAAARVMVLWHEQQSRRASPSKSAFATAGPFTCEPVSEPAFHKPLLRMRSVTIALDPLAPAHGHTLKVLPKLRPQRVLDSLGQGWRSSTVATIRNSAATPLACASSCSSPSGSATNNSLRN